MSWASCDHVLFLMIPVITLLDKLTVTQNCSSVNVCHRKMMHLPKISDIQNDHKALENSELS